MSYGNAQLLMQGMTGFSVNTTASLDGWQGGMDFVYKTGLMIIMIQMQLKLI